MLRIWEDSKSFISAKCLNVSVEILALVVKGKNYCWIIYDTSINMLKFGNKLYQKPKSSNTPNSNYFLICWMNSKFILTYKISLLN